MRKCPNKEKFAYNTPTACTITHLQHSQLLSSCVLSSVLCDVYISCIEYPLQ